MNVNSTHLSGSGNNDQIITDLGFKSKEFLSECYGYSDRGGCWPDCHCSDYPALTRAVKRIFQEIDKKEGKKQKEEIINQYQIY